MTATPTLRVLAPSTAAEFAEVAMPFLSAEPLLHSVILTRLAQELGDSANQQEAVWRCVITIEPDGSRGPVVAALMMTPPHSVYLSPAPEPAVRLLADHLWDDGIRPCGVGGLGDGPRYFADQWVLHTDGPAPVVAQRTGVLELDQLLLPPPVPGRFRPATTADLPLLLQWGNAFAAEATPGAAPQDHITPRVRAGLLHVWDVDGATVSMVAVTAPQAGASRVQLVYTPKALRGRGYAGACVAALTQAELANPGRKCLLYTDLANPTSNALYERLGYRRIAEGIELRF